jgi:adenine-specific DNA-methyltransferase
MCAKKADKKPLSVDSLKHKDKRKNIPMEELRDSVAADENAPKTMLYPRDPSLDPQLVWKCKDDKIAIKVINHYGDEVLKVYNIRR